MMRNWIMIGLAAAMGCAAATPEYLGAEVYSQDTVKYGRWEMRMLMGGGGGTISSFFLYYPESWRGGAEPWCEIDVEVIGKDTKGFQSNLITGSAASKQNSEAFHESAQDLAATWHTYAVDWTPDSVVWRLDDQVVRRSTSRADDPASEQVIALRAKAMTWRWNLWSSTSVPWAGAFDSASLPYQQFVKWLRYSKYTPGQATGDFTPAWTEEFDTWNGGDWGMGDWTFPDNRVTFSKENVNIQDGVLAMTLTKASAPGFSGLVPPDSGSTAIRRKEDARQPLSVRRTSGGGLALQLPGEMRTQPLDIALLDVRGRTLRSWRNPDVQEDGRLELARVQGEGVRLLRLKGAGTSRLVRVPWL